MSTVMARLAPPELGVESSAAWALRPAGVYLASRATVLVAVGVAVSRTPGLALNSALLHWDGGWYLLVARAGYPRHLPVVSGQVSANTTAFFPLFPMTIRALSALTGLSQTTSGLALDSAFGLIGALVIWVLARDRWGEAAAGRACALFCFFPGAFVLSLVYAEGLMIALAAGCLLALSRRAWWTAGALAALATATRPNAIALGVACAWAALGAIRDRREWCSLVAPALAPSGILAYFGFLWARTGSMTAWFTTEAQGWHETFDASATWTRITEFVQHPFPGLDATMGMVCLAFVVIAAAVVLWARLPGPWVAYAGVVVALTAVSRLYGVTPRFLLSAFPIAMAFGYRLRGAAFAVTLSASAAALGWLTVVSVSSLRLTP